MQSRVMSSLKKIRSFYGFLFGEIGDTDGRGATLNEAPREAGPHNIRSSKHLDLEHNA